MEISRDALKTLMEQNLAGLDERQRRVFVGSMALALGRGGVTRVAEASGMSRSTVTTGSREVQAGRHGPAARVRQPGAGRPTLLARDPG